MMANKTPSYGCRARIYCTNDSTLAEHDFAGGDQYIDVVYTQCCDHTHKQDLVYKDMVFNFLLYDQRGDIALDPFITRGYKHRFLCIIGHPVMIGDVIDYTGEKKIDLFWNVGDATILLHYTGEKKIDLFWSDSSHTIDIRDGEKSLNLFSLWGNKRHPIDEQTNECIDYVYSLIQKS